MAKFRNDTKDKVKVRISTKKTNPGYMGDYLWKTVKPGDEVELPEAYGKRLGFKQISIITKIAEKIVDAAPEIIKPKSDDGFFDKIRSIRGIGRKTAKDIIAQYPDEMTIRMAIANDEHIPFDDNIAEKLKDEFKD